MTALNAGPAAMAEVLSIDPRTGAVVESVAREFAPGEVDRVVTAAARQTEVLRKLGASGRADLLEAIARRLEEDAEEIISVADRESALGIPRLTGEMARTCHQMRLFAKVLRDGAYVEAIIDTPESGGGASTPDLRRLLVPLGPVAVFGASNFPLAFSVPGGDVASALAAGCPVVVKAHPSHPATSERCAEAIRRGATDVGVPADCLGLVHGQQAGIDLVQHPAITAVAFTGSLRAGRFLMDLCSARPVPVPFYGEFGSINPVVVTPSAAARRRDAIAQGYVASMTLGTGQFCTKPGVILVPSNPAGDELAERIQQEIRATTAGWLLNEGISAAYRSQIAALRQLRGVFVLGAGRAATGSGFTGTPLLLTTTVDALRNGAGAVLEECFGPVSIVIRYGTAEELLHFLESMDGSLTATIHGEDDDELGARVLEKVAAFAGRVIWNGFPTGVTVAWSTNHGGPYPSTSNALHTSVGATAIRRFLRPLAMQDVPHHLLPAELQDNNPLGIPRRVDGAYVLPETATRGASTVGEDA